MTVTPEDPTSDEHPTPGAPGAASASPRPSRAPRSALRDFLYRLVAYVKSRKLYPPGHDRLAKQLEVWLEAAQTVFAHQEAVSLFIQPDAIFVGGEKFGADDRIAKEFAPELVKRLIRYVSIEPGVTIPELEALAEPLLLEPQALQEAGGARELLSEGDVSHVFIIEFSYEMGRYLTSEEDVEVVRTLARYEQGVLPEQYVLNRLGELGISGREKALLRSLLLDPEVGRRLSSLGQALRRFAGASDEEVHTSDLIVYVVRSLVQTEEEPGELTPARASQILSQVLDGVNERLLVALSEPDEQRRREVLSRVAGQMMASPEALLRWLAPDADRMSLTLSPDLAELLKAIFSRAESGRRRLSFGETALQTLAVQPETSAEEPEEEPEGDAARPPRAEDREVDLAALAERFVDLRQELGGRRYVLGLDRVTPAYSDVLLELLLLEDQPAARERILRELSVFLSRQLSQGDGEMDLAGRFLGGAAQLGREDLEALLLAPEVCRRAFREYLQGEERWRGPLERVSRRHQANSARALGLLVLESEPALSTRELSPFIRACQDELVDWLQRRLDDQEHPPPLERVVSLVLACRTIRMVPLVERLLGEVAPDAVRALLRALVEIEDPRAVSVLADLLADGDGFRRGAILYLLGQSGHSLAEEVLLEEAARRHWPGGSLEERLAALSSLARVGSVRSLELLGGLARSWLLGLTGGGRQVRERAGQALAAVQARLAAPSAEEGEPASEEVEG